MPTTDAQTIARGGQPVWERTYQHPEHGDLTFIVERAPTTEDWLAHQMHQEQIAPGITSVLAAAVAAMRTFMRPPIIDETRDQDPDNPDHIKVTTIRYDPMTDTNIEFVMRVWTEFYAWRAGLLDDSTLEQVKNSSGATSGDADGDSSPATTASRQPTPESPQ